MGRVYFRKHDDEIEGINYVGECMRAFIDALLWGKGKK